MKKKIAALRLLFALLLTALLVAAGMPGCFSVSAASDPIETAAQNLAAFRSVFTLQTSDAGQVIHEAFVRYPELFYYYNGYSYTQFGGMATVTVSYCNTEVTDVQAVSGLTGLTEAIRQALAAGQNHLHLVAVNGAGLSDSVNLDSLMYSIRTADYLSFMGYDSIAVNVRSSTIVSHECWSVEIGYLCDTPELLVCREQTRQQVALLAATLWDEDDPDWLRALKIYEYIIGHTDYDTVGTDMLCHTAYGCLIRESCVCDGYTEAANLLLRAAGIDSRGVYGTHDGTAHAWNLVKLGGDWYHMDLTMGDVRYTDGSTGILYDYFGMNDTTIPARYVWSGSATPAADGTRYTGAAVVALRESGAWMTGSEAAAPSVVSAVPEPVSSDAQSSSPLSEAAAASSSSAALSEAQTVSQPSAATADSRPASETAVSESPSSVPSQLPSSSVDEAASPNGSSLGRVGAVVMIVALVVGVVAVGVLLFRRRPGR